MTAFRENVATNLCGESNCTSFVSSANAAIACTEYGKDWPAAGGRVTMQFWSDPCPPSDIPSLNICFQNSFQLAFCAKDPPIGQDYNTKTFITNYGYFSTPSSVQGTAAQLRWSAVLTDATKQNVTISILIEALNQYNGVNQWDTWHSGSYTLPIVNTYQRNSGNAFQSNPQYIPISVNMPNCEITYMSLGVGLQPLRMGCGTGENDYTCALYDGNNYLTCARGLVKYKNGIDLPSPFLLGLNGSTCSNTSTCGCEQCSVTTTYYDCLFNTDADFYKYVKTNFDEPVNEQQSIQVATGAPFPVMLKIVQGIRYVYWCPTGNTNTWLRTEFNVIQSNKPTIILAEDSDHQIYIYFTKFPSADLVPDCPPDDAPALIQSAPAVKSTRAERFASRVSGGCGCGRKAQTFKPK